MSDVTGEPSLSMLLSVPIVSAFIGYITNYIAVKMLFRPRRQVSVLGIKFHGLVPRRQSEIAARLGEMIERDLLSHDDIQAVLTSKETSAEAARFLHEQVDAFVQKMGAANPMIGAFLQGPLLEQVKAMLTNQMNDKFPQFMEGIVVRLEKDLDIQAIIKTKIEAFDLDRLEKLIYEISRKELKTIEVLGGVLGFIVGLGQVGLMLLAR